MSARPVLNKVPLALGLAKLSVAGGVNTLWPVPMIHVLTLPNVSAGLRQMFATDCMVRLVCLFGSVVCACASHSIVVALID